MEAAEIRAALSAENQKLWETKTLLFKRDHPMYVGPIPQPLIFGVSYPQAKANYENSVD